MSSSSVRRRRVPVVGVTAAQGQTQNGLPAILTLQSYLLALLAAGAAPVLIPPSLDETKRDAVYRRLDGLLFSGGGDIAPEWYGGENGPKVGLADSPRDVLEIALCRAAVQDGKPFLGICRGLQVLNVSQGGTLYADLAVECPQAVCHDYSAPTWPPEYPSHRVEVISHSLLAQVLGETRLTVNSRHHQGVKDLAPGLVPCAWAPDGLVEAIEVAGHPFGLAVQWHPESLTTQPASRRLFHALVEACAKTMQGERSE